uniref:Uncharacterized protein n=1 Tax=Pristhesancus plagipennis TaxID=1955184 RepID=A0A2K8JMU6_PRIPG|nr:secreted hypothetical protein [Pristhesancus plagipennis]
MFCFWSLIGFFFFYAGATSKASIKNFCNQFLKTAQWLVLKI